MVLDKEFSPNTLGTSVPATNSSLSRLPPSRAKLSPSLSRHSIFIDVSVCGTEVVILNFRRRSPMEKPSLGDGSTFGPDTPVTTAVSVLSPVAVLASASTVPHRYDRAAPEPCLDARAGHLSIPRGLPLHDTTLRIPVARHRQSRHRHIPS